MVKHTLFLLLCMPSWSGTYNNFFSFFFWHRNKRYILEVENRYSRNWCFKTLWYTCMIWNFRTSLEPPIRINCNEYFLAFYFESVGTRNLTSHSHGNTNVKLVSDLHVVLYAFSCAIIMKNFSVFLSNNFVPSFSLFCYLSTLFSLINMLSYLLSYIVIL